MAITYVGTGTTVYSTGNPDPGAITGQVAGDILILAVGTKPDTTPATTPAGWTLLGAVSGGTGTTGIDTGPMRVGIFYKIATASGETPGPITITGNNISTASLYAFRAGAGAQIDIVGTGAADTSTGTPHSAVMPINPGLTVGDALLAVGVIPTDVTTPAQFSAQTVAAAGMTTVSMTEIEEWDTASGQDMGGWVARGAVVTGTSTGAPTVSATAGGTTTNVAGPIYLVRIREIVTTLKSASDSGTVSATDTSSVVKTTTVANSASDAGTVSGVESVTIKKTSPPPTPDFDEASTVPWNTTTISHTTTVSAQAGDVLVAFFATEGVGSGSLSGGGLTWTQRVNINVAGYSALQAWTATVSSTASFDVTVNITGKSTGNMSGLTVLRFIGGSGVGNSSSDYFQTAQGDTPFTNVTVSQNSGVVAMVVDWNATDMSTSGWGNGISQLDYFRSSADYALTIGYKNNLTAGSFSALHLGEGTKYSMGAIEILGGAAGGDPEYLVSDVGSISAAESASLVKEDFVDSTITHVQSNSMLNQSSSNTVSLAYPSNNTAGNFLIAAFVVDGTFANSVPTSVTDTRGNTWYNIPPASAPSASGIYSASGTLTLSVWYAKDVGGGANTVTANLPAASAYKLAAISEYSGVHKTSPIDVVKDNIATATSAANNVTTGNFTTGFTNAYIWNVVQKATNSNNLTPGTGYTQRTIQQNNIMIQDRAFATPGTTAATSTFSTGGVYLTYGVGIRPEQFPEGAGGEPIAGSDSGTVSATDTATLVKSIAINDSGTLSGVDASTLSKSAGLVDSGTLSAVDSSSLFINANLSVSDSGTLSAADASSLIKTINLVDSGTVSAVDTLAVSSTLSSTDSGTVSATESATVFNNRPTTDAGTISAVDASSISIGGQIDKSANDTGSISATETVSIASSTSTSDLGTLSSNDVSTNAVSSTRTDAGTISAVDNALVFVSAALSANDSGTVSATDASAISVTLAVTDSGSVSALEDTVDAVSSSRTDAGTISATDTSTVFKTATLVDSGSISATDSTSMSVTRPLVDSGTISATDASSTFKTIALSDAGTVSGTDAAVVFNDRPTTDSGSISGADSSTVVISGQIDKSAVDSGTLSALDTSSNASTLSRSETGSISAVESTSTASTIARTDAGTLSATDSSISALSSTSTDSGTLSGTDASTLVKNAALSDSGTISATDVASIARGISLTDSGTLSAVETIVDIYEDNARGASDQGTLSATEGKSIYGVATAADQGTISATDASTIVKSFGVTDAGTLSGADTASVFNNRPTTDSGVLSGIDSASVEISGTIVKSGTDSGSVSATESRTIASTLSRTDTGTLSATDVSSLFKTRPINDAGTISATDTSTINKNNTRSDSGTLSATDDAVVQKTDGTPVNVWSGTEWIVGSIKVWDGSQWKSASIRRWTGNSWA